MAWAVLVVSGVLEAVWAGALAATNGFTRLAPTVLFLVTLTLSMAGLAYAMQTLPLGTAYAVWVGIGATGAAIYGMLAHGDPATVGRIVCLLLIVAGVAGLKFLH